MSKMKTLPLLPLRDIVVFPHMIVPLFVGREKSVKALEEVMRADKQILLATQRTAGDDEPANTAIHATGVIASVLQLLKLPDGTVKVLVEGGVRVEITGYTDNEIFYEAMCEPIVEETGDPSELEALMRTVAAKFDDYVKLNKKVPPEALASLAQISDPAKLSDSIAAHLAVKIDEKQALLEQPDAARRLERILGLMEGEIGVLQVEKKIRSRVKRQMEKTQREYYLNEQMKAIQRELGEGDDSREELAELEDRLAEAKLSKEARTKADAEFKKLRQMSPMSAEATVVRNYLDWILALPWGKRKRLKNDLTRAEEVLEADHYGLEKVKERILEHLAVQARTKKMRGPILCLVGPPGVGKTSLGRSIAKATGRDFVRMSLGGVRDEAEIRGHRRTYIGSTFNDHYLEVDYDLSDIMFVTTANTLNLPQPLLDRMEVIRIAGYTEDEKLEIAKRHLIPKQMVNHALTPSDWSLADDAVRDLVRYYAHEAGVRNLEREIANLARKSVRRLQGGKVERVDITAENLGEFAGVRKYRFGESEREDRVGLVTGLAWTEAGGDLLQIEAVKMPGRGKMTVTGNLRDVMKESISAANSFVQSRAPSMGIRPTVFRTTDIHVHVPEGATPKDGPSAGVGMMTAIVSVLTGIPVRKDLAMTGEITLRGHVLPIGGLKEKLLAALRGGVKTVLIPKENEKDLVEIPDNVKQGLEIIPVETADEVLARALTQPVEAVEWTDADAAALAGMATATPDGGEAQLAH